MSRSILSINCVRDTIQNIVNKIQQFEVSNITRQSGLFNLNYWFSNCKFSYSELETIVNSIVEYISERYTDIVNNNLKLRIDISSDEQFGIDGIKYIIDSGLSLLKSICPSTSQSIIITNIENSTVPFEKLQDILKNYTSVIAERYLFDEESYLILKIKNEFVGVSDCTIPNEEQSIHTAKLSFVGLVGIYC